MEAVAILRLIELKFHLAIPIAIRVEESHSIVQNEGSDPISCTKSKQLIPFIDETKILSLEGITLTGPSRPSTKLPAVRVAAARAQETARSVPPARVAGVRV